MRAYHQARYSWYNLKYYTSIPKLQTTNSDFRLEVWKWMQIINGRLSDGCDYLSMLVLKLIHVTALDSSSLTDFHSWSECNENRGISAVVKLFLWYWSQIQVYTHERNIVSCVKNIGTSGTERLCYLDTTKTMTVCACLFSTTCSWLDLVPLHGDSSIINFCTMSRHVCMSQHLGIHLVVFEGEYIVRWYQFQYSAGHSTEWRNIVFELQNNWGFVLYPHQGATCRYSLPKMADGKTSRRESLHLIMLLCTDQCHI